MASGASEALEGRVLVVEDETNARTALRALLEDEGYEVRAATDGEDALRQLAGWTPDVVLTDVKMPRLGGLELMGRLGQRLPGVPVIVMTAFGSIEHAVETMHLGAADYLPKPVDLARLRESLARVLGRTGAPLRTGDVVAGRYRIDGKLGEGAMGAVYRATQLNLGRAVALKMLTVHREVPDARARLLREARVASALRHPNAVQVHDVGEDHGRPYLVMELLDGYDLRAHVGHGAPPLAIPKLLRIARQIASVLVAAHRIGLVHRDLKPENIFLERFEGGERVRVLDFGVAFIADERAAESGRLTQEGVVIGTPFYIAPEQAAGRAIGPAADIYAFGVLLFEMATGRLPFGGTNMEVMAAHMREAPQAPGELRDDLPPALEALILAMLRKGPGLRPTAVQVESRLREIDDGRPGAGVEGWEIDPEETTLRGQVLASSVAGPATVRSPVMQRVLLVGEVSAEVAAGLQGEGIALERLVDPSRQIREAACVLAIGETMPVIDGLVRLGVPVIADVERGDVDRSVALRALGVAARLVRPVTARAIAELVRRLVADDDEGRRTLHRV